jgi:NADH:ubiquinone oxidoreductase subunit F (NADH-binding)/(2Fe-2S) ferredoxin/NAD-dependent dihydropyrimidine dehydrogenase PreA subunit
MSDAITRIRTLEDLDQAARLGRATLYPDRIKILVGTATCGRAAGAGEVLRAVREEVEKSGLPYAVAETGCIGWCSQEPLLDLWIPGRGRLTYGRIKPADARKIVRGIAKGELQLDRAIAHMPGDDNTLTGQWTSYAASPDGFFGATPAHKDLPLFRYQVRIVTRNCGLINPASLEEYCARGGYRALYRALHEMAPEQVIAEVITAGLRGRGGAGFPTGRKWDLMRRQAATPKYVICNADEGDPGAYMNRTELESDPHSVLEGMIIGAYAMGAAEGIIYVRAEYPLAVDRVRAAIAQLHAVGLLGENILGSGFSFSIRIVQGAGAFVCGEETALIASVEGHVGEPHPRPPYPVERGLWGKPTVINNVESWANVPVITLRGGAWFATVGTQSSKGTKGFCLVGNVKNTGLIEVPMGITLRQVVYEVGGGSPTGRPCKAIQTGGPSGGCIPEALFDLPVDYESLTRAGSIMGSGGMVVMDEDTCMVDVARYFMEFLEEESCGKCFPCRVGTQRLREILARICQGKGAEEDLVVLGEMGGMIKEASLCGLGQTAPNPVLTTLRYFRDEYLAHIRDRKCPAKVCKELVVYHIEPTLCDGCGACLKVCASDAILGEKKKVHEIDTGKCIRCGACLEVCQPKAVLVT